MSPHYKHNEILPLPVIVAILHELDKAEAAGRESVAREFDMRIPEEPDHDADLGLFAAAKMLEQLDQSKALLASVLPILAGLLHDEAITASTRNLATAIDRITAFLEEK